MDSREFWLEKRLRDLDPELHRLYTDAVVALHRTLSGYLRIFPEYTDHSDTHALVVVQFCNEILDKRMMEQMNADEIFVLLLGCYLHDIGMGITEDDFREFSAADETLAALVEGEEIQDAVRKYHNEFSACFIHKYAPLFDFPSDKHTYAIAQVARGHRKCDLFDEEDYPSELTLDNGNTVCLPYLAALVRLADEVDVAADRNSEIIYDVRIASTEKQAMEFAKHAAIKKVTVKEDAFVLDIDCSDERVYREVIKLFEKTQETLDYCVAVVEQRTPYEITQKEIKIRETNNGKEISDGQTERWNR